MNRYEEKLKNSSTMNVMHLPKSGEDVFSFHQNGKQKTSWYLSSWQTMSATNIPTNPNLVTYHSKIYPYHGLHRAMLTTVTPSIRAAEGYEIRFCEDLFINMVNEFRLVFNDTELQFGNRASLKFDLKHSKEWKEMKHDIGNIPALTEWRETLPSTPIAMYPSMTYAQGRSDYFPLQLCGNRDDLSHIFDFNLQLKDLIMIRRDGEDVPFSMDLINVSGNVESIPIPEMEGLYTSLTKEECKYNVCLGKDERTPEFYTKSIYYIEDENEILMGKKTQLKFDSKKSQPITRIDWGAINVKETEHTKNLTFNEHPSENSPIKHTTLDTSIETLFRNKVSYKTERAYHLLSGIQYIPGMNSWENNVLVREDGRKFSPAICFDGGNMVVTLNEPSEEGAESKYLVFAILRYVTRFRFTSYPKTQEERLEIGASIVGEEENEN